ncbi:FYDLN acid domain-containing protein [Sphingomonas jaspsi]|uniref:FYDLN acid domain-containing protein n=1 Tax=Sphingomonas jaspsi TaxID=392409 RepID=UPI0004B38AC8|nr:FYDLN acid domain-containing protein [Sphingomonas jaspsi]
MVKPEWGTKRTCPKCSTRFYDLTKDEPVTCIECGNQWHPEPVLKSKQPLPYEAVQADKPVKDDEDLGADDLAIDEDEEPSADDEVDLSTGDDDLGVATGDEDEEN